MYGGVTSLCIPGQLGLLNRRRAPFVCLGQRVLDPHATELQLFAVCEEVLAQRKDFDSN
jgi:hypothetical protein